MSVPKNPNDEILGRKYEEEFGNDMIDLINAGVDPSSIAMDSKHHPTIYNYTPLNQGKDNPNNCRCSDGQYQGMDRSHNSCGCGKDKNCGCNQGYYNQGQECCCDDEITDYNSCSIEDLETLRIYKKTHLAENLLGLTTTDQKLDGIGYKVYDFVTDYNSVAGMYFETEYCGKHKIIFECTGEEIKDDQFKTCTLNSLYFDPNECKYIYRYHFLGIPDPGDPTDPDIPTDPGSTDVLLSFLHQSYKLRAKIGMYLNDIDLEPIKRDGGRTFYCCLSDLITGQTNDEIIVNPTGDNGKLSESDFFSIAQFASYTENDYTAKNTSNTSEYGIVEDYNSTDRSKNPPISKYKVGLCPGDADILCISDVIEEHELDGYMIYEAQPLPSNDPDGDGNPNWFFKLQFVLKNGREFWFFSSSESQYDGCTNNDTVCLGDGIRVQESTECGKSLSGCNLVSRASAKEGWIESGCITIKGFHYSFKETKKFDVGSSTEMTMVWAELETNDCGGKTIQFKHEIVNYTDSTAMEDLGKRLYKSRYDIVPIVAFQYVDGTAESEEQILFNDYREYIDLNNITYNQQYSTTNAFKKMDLVFFQPVSRFSANIKTSSNHWEIKTQELGIQLIDGSSAGGYNTYEVIGQGSYIDSSGGINLMSEIHNDLGERTSLGITGGVGGRSVVSCDYSIDTAEGIKVISNSTGVGINSANFGFITNFSDPKNIINKEPNDIKRFQITAQENLMGEIHLRSYGLITKGVLPIFFVAIREQN